MVGAYIAIGVAAAVVIFFIVLIVRTALAKTAVLPKTEYAAKSPDKQRLTDILVGAVQIETVTMQNQAKEDGTKFFKYQEYIESQFPLVFAVAEKTLVNTYAAIYKVEGSDKSLLPLGILAHQDVVPAPAEGWEVPPFSGEIKDGCVYGRGSQDMKSQMVAALEGLEMQLAAGEKLKRSIYFCFGHDEEFRGVEGATEISKYLERQGIRFEFVVDEGGTVLDGAILGIPKKIALIGTCEKGYADFHLSVEKVGGHASAPARKTACGILAKAVYKLEKKKFKPFWSVPTSEMFDSLAPNMAGVFKFLFINRKVFSFLLKPVLGLVHPMTSCLIRTTLVPTQLKGADAPNVIPPRATATLNCRINTGDTVENVKKRIEKIAGKDVVVTIDKGWFDPCPVSPISSYGYKTLEKTISEVFNGFITAPFMFTAATDSKYYYNICENVFRFTPFEKSEDDLSRIHATNERQNIEQFVTGTEFFRRLYENSCF
ncbi:MAG: M20/M25/M40 family metallo-hydrolase [Christensenellaceae bacterium]|jgi:carboxypeptidase PM20D1|nr:M20/M25/M40 family metallo-hydrolase [Christensenellaceae bacterium]